MKMMKVLKSNEKGFTYLSLIIGITILLIGLGFFTALFRTSRVSISIAKEQMAMATVAQNMAQVYMATNNETTAEDQGKSEGYALVDLSTFTGSPVPAGLKKVSIIVNSKITSDSSNPRYVEPYKLVFYANQ